jgi:hypothetical protein
MPSVRKPHPTVQYYRYPFWLRAAPSFLSRPLLLPVGPGPEPGPLHITVARVMYLQTAPLALAHAAQFRHFTTLSQYDQPIILQFLCCIFLWLTSPHRVCTLHPFDTVSSLTAPHSPFITQALYRRALNIQPKEKTRQYGTITSPVFPIINFRLASSPTIYGSCQMQGASHSVISLSKVRHASMGIDALYLTEQSNSKRVDISPSPIIRVPLTSQSCVKVLGCSRMRN